VIKTEKLSKTFKVGFKGKKVHALTGLDIEVGEGEIFGFLGPNGAGKTTTIKLLMGLIYPSSGKAWLMGEELGKTAVKNKIGFLPENPYFYDYLTGREFLNFYGQLFGLKKDERKERLEKLLALVNMEGAKDIQLRKYSKGMLQRVGIAQALINDPKLVILDEPMSGLDPIGRKEVRDIILNLKDRGKTVFFSTHILPDVEMICDRVGTLIKGTLRDIGPLEELLGTQIKNIDITVRGLSEIGLNKVGSLVNKVIKREDTTFFSTENEEIADRVLKIIDEEKGKLVSFIPQMESLEEHFMKQARDSTTERIESRV
jgi:ABC-2 type transport system ATP-binding protein